MERHTDGDAAAALARRVSDMTGCYVGIVLMQPVSADGGVLTIATSSGFAVGDDEDLWLLTAVSALTSAAASRIERTEPSSPEGEEHRALIRAAAAPLLAASDMALGQAEGVH